MLCISGYNVTLSYIIITRDAHIYYNNAQASYNPYIYGNKSTSFGFLSVDAYDIIIIAISVVKYKL